MADTMQELEAQLISEIRQRAASPLMVELGCGQSALADGFIGADLKIRQANVLRVDLFTAPWPWDTGSVDFFASSHFLEHVPDWEAHFGEVYRCLRPGGYYRAIGPYAKSDRYLQDPTHCQPLHENKILYLNQDWLRVNKIAHDHAAVNFSIVALGFVWNSAYDDASGVSLEARERARSHMWNVVDDIHFILRKEPMPE